MYALLDHDDEVEVRVPLTGSTSGSAPAAVGIQARGLTKRYGNTTVVDDLSFTTEPGVINGFLGPNGAGKSTTMRMLLGLVKPTQGQITIGGRHIAELDDPARTVGALLDAHAVHPTRTAHDHLLAFAQTADLRPIVSEGACTPVHGCRRRVG